MVLAFIAYNRRGKPGHVSDPNPADSSSTMAFTNPVYSEVSKAPGGQSSDEKDYDNPELGERPQMYDAITVISDVDEQPSYDSIDLNGVGGISNDIGYDVVLESSYDSVLHLDGADDNANVVDDEPSYDVADESSSYLTVDSTNHEALEADEEAGEFQLESDDNAEEEFDLRSDGEAGEQNDIEVDLSGSEGSDFEV